jgi:hypothetical protein
VFNVGGGGTALGTTVKKGGLEVLFSGSVIGSGTSASTISSGGTFQATGFDASKLPINLLTGGTGEIGSSSSFFAAAFAGEEPIFPTRGISCSNPSRPARDCRRRRVSASNRPGRSGTATPDALKQCVS